MHDPNPRADAFVGRSVAACAVRAQLATLAASDANVLLLGPTGSGKEIAARLVHDLSSRSAGPFVPIDCGALMDGLAESDLFGHAAGAFTGATGARNGLLVQADGGTIFLDEIANATAGLQARLLRVLETREVRPVGANRAKPFDVRIVAAANRDLAAEVRAGRFREDLLYRLDVLRLQLPALDDRIDDVEDLVEHLLQRVGRRSGVTLRIRPAAITELRARHWPGNVRQLRNAIERAAAVSRGGPIDIDHLPPRDDVARDLPKTGSSWRSWQAESERAFLLGQLDAHGWNRSATARALGMSRQTLHERLRRHGLRPQLVSPARTTITGTTLRIV